MSPSCNSFHCTYYKLYIASRIMSFDPINHHLHHLCNCLSILDFTILPPARWRLKHAICPLTLTLKPPFFQMSITVYVYRMF